MLALALLAWGLTVAQWNAMGNGPGTMGMPLVSFVAMWAAMKTAMMLPSVAPVAILWSRAIVRRTGGIVRLRRLILFVTGYLVVWVAVGGLAYVAFGGFEWLLRRVPLRAGALGAGVFAAAAAFQLSPLKDLCLRHCRSPTAFLARFTAMRGPALDLRIGAYHGLYCTGCCWGLVIVLIGVGVMNVAVMAVLAALIFAEKTWSRGEALARATGYALLAVAVVAFWYPDLFPGLRVVGAHHPGHGG